jgi:hypothetical protein
MTFEFDAANPPRPPPSSNSFEIVRPLKVNFSPTVRLRKSFSRNTYGFPRKCCKQKTYGAANPFRCNTYKKQGGGAYRFLRLINCENAPFFSCTYETLFS